MIPLFRGRAFALVLPLVAFIPSTAFAQCTFNPTVLPADLVLCPNTQSTLTTQVYDGYQWYKDGNLIPGATAATHPVDAYADGGSYFSVKATLDGCTEMSPQVLVDGWVFLPPTVITDEGYLYIDQDGAAVFCQGDTAFLVLMQPYDTNIQWTRNGVPVAGATDDTLMVTDAGNYSVSGAPSLCPNYMQELGVEVGIDLIPPVQPVIVADGTTLCADASGDAYQWYLNGAPLAGNTPCIDGSAEGIYTVDVTYQIDCSIPSEPYLSTGMDTRSDPNKWQVYPRPASNGIAVSWNDGSTIDQWHLFDALGREMEHGSGVLRSPFTIDVGNLGTGSYWLVLGSIGSVAVSVVR